MEINKRCKWCGSPFIAQKVSTQFCSHRCANASYKRKKRNEKLEKSLEEDAQLHPLELKGTMDKPYLSPLEDDFSFVDFTFAYILNPCREIFVKPYLRFIQ